MLYFTLQTLLYIDIGIRHGYHKDSNDCVAKSTEVKTYIFLMYE